MNHRKALTLSNIVGIAGIAIGAFLYFFNEDNWVFYTVMAISIGMICAGLVIIALFYRCPHCRERLPQRMWNPPEYCPHCGEKLE